MRIVPTIEGELLLKVIDEKTGTSFVGWRSQYPMSGKFAKKSLSTKPSSPISMPKSMDIASDPSIHVPFRIVREAEEPLGLFFRPGREDHSVVSQLLSEGRVGTLGAVFDPCHCDFQEVLRNEMRERHLDAILDPTMMELATVGGHTSVRARLPWAGTQPHVPSDFDRTMCDRAADQIAQFVAAKHFTAVLAPTHYLAQGARDPWFEVDRRLVSCLRQRLDSNGCGDVAIYYPLAIPTSILINSGSRMGLKASLASFPIDALWLRIHPFGSSSGDTTLRRYILACRELHGLQIPIIAEKTGMLGLALLAFGAVAGVESGISVGEKFDYMRLKRVMTSGKKFARSSRIYLPDLGAFLTREQANQFFQLRGLRQFACRDTACCRDGHTSMIANSRRHFAYTRMGEINSISRVTPSLRSTAYLEEILRPATDNLGRALAHDELPDLVKNTLERTRKKLDGWRATLGEMSRSRIVTYSVPIERRIHRARKTA